MFDENISRKSHCVLYMYLEARTNGFGSLNLCDRKHFLCRGIGLRRFLSLRLPNIFVECKDRNGCPRQNGESAMRKLNAIDLFERDSFENQMHAVLLTTIDIVQMLPIPSVGFTARTSSAIVRSHRLIKHSNVFQLFFARSPVTVFADFS